MTGYYGRWSFRSFRDKLLGSWTLAQLVICRSEKHVNVLWSKLILMRTTPFSSFSPSLIIEVPFHSDQPYPLIFPFSSSIGVGRIFGFNSTQVNIQGATASAVNFILKGRRTRPAHRPDDHNQKLHKSEMV